MFRDLALPCVRHAKNGAIEVDGPDAEGLRMFCLVALTRASDDDVVGALTFIVRGRELDEARLALGSVLRADSQH